MAIEIEQRRAFRDTRTYRLTDDDQLEVVITQKGRRSEFRVPVEELQPGPSRETRGSRNELIAAVGGALVTIAFLVWAITLPKTTQEQIARFSMLVTVCVIVAGAVCYGVVRVFRSRFDILIYHGRSGQGTLTFLWGRPDERRFREFIAELDKRIENCEAEVNAKRGYPATGESLGLELQKIAELYEKGVLDEVEFAAAKSALLNAPDGGRVIGFSAV